jgi:hypothetical protein
LPAILYALQNVLTQYGYQMLDSVTFNLLNQTKILSSAFCLWIVMKQKQSARQIFALFILLQAALLLSLPKDMLGLLAERAFSVVPLITTHLQRADFVNAVNAGLSIPRTVFDFVVASAQTANVGASGARYQKGVLMVMAASALSGVCAALTQRSLQQSKRNALFYSAEMAVYGIIALLVSSLNLSFNKGGLSLDPSGLEELTRGVMFPSDLHAMNIVKRNPLWVFIPIIVNVSFSPLSLSPSLPLSLSPPLPLSLPLSLTPLFFLLDSLRLLEVSSSASSPNMPAASTRASPSSLAFFCRAWCSGFTRRSLLAHRTSWPLEWSRSLCSCTKPRVGARSKTKPQKPRSPKKASERKKKKQVCVSGSDLKTR